MFSHILYEIHIFQCNEIGTSLHRVRIRVRVRIRIIMSVALYGVCRTLLHLTDSHISAIHSAFRTVTTIL